MDHIPINQNNNNEDIADTFRELDTSLIEIFNRGEYADLLQDRPINEQNQRLEGESWLELLRTQSERRRVQDSDRFIYLFYIFGLIPLPIINFRQVWRNHTLYNLASALFRILMNFFVVFVKIVRLISLIVATSIYFNRIIRMLLEYNNLITFSDNFLKDAFTYIFRGSKNLLQRHEEIFRHHSNIFYFLDEAESYSSWQILTTSIYNWSTDLLMTNCVMSRNEDGKAISSCELNTDTLIFKFADVVRDYFPYFISTSPLMSTFSTVVIYISYSFVGTFLFYNFLFFFSTNMVKRLLIYKDVYSKLGTIIWNTLYKNIV